MQVNRELERQFVADTKTQFGVPFDEYYNKYIKWLEEKAIQTQAGVGVPSETLSCELEGRIKELKRFEKTFDLCKPEDGCIECDSRREIIRRRIISIEQKIEQLKASKP